MCDICDKARKLPKAKALEAVAQAMQKRGFPPCLDRLVGELVGEPEPKVDRAAEQAWESRRRSRE